MNRIFRNISTGERVNVKELVELRFNLNEVRDENGSSLIHQAAYNGRLSIVEKLLAAGINPNLRDAEGATALHHASQMGYADVCNRLVMAGADANAREING